MADSESFHHHRHHHLSSTPSTFSQLLFCNELDDYNPVGNSLHHLGYLGDVEGDYVGGEIGLFGPDKSGITTCKDSTNASLPASETNRGSSGNKRKARLENPSSGGKTRVREGRREKLGDRITALQQLVSPFGKTDTASVLHEAMGYIRFLHDQVQFLCSPYLQPQPKVEESGEGKEPRRNLRSRGLCLVPVECTVHVASSNGADYWSPGGIVNDVVSLADDSHAVNLN